jgi:hypothetical protein
MRSCKEAVAFAEMARIQRKIRSGNATAVEKERYQYLLQRKESGVSVRLHPNFPSPLDRTQSIEGEEGWHPTQYDDVVWKRVPPIPTARGIHQPMNHAYQVTGTQIPSPQGNFRLYNVNQASSSSNFKSKSAPFEALRLARERAANWNETESKNAYQVRLISPNKPASPLIKAGQLVDASVNGKKRLHAPIPMRDNDANKRQKPISNNSSCKESSAIIGILRNHKTSSPPSQQISKIDPSAFMRAMRASQVTRGQQRSLLEALRAGSSSSFSKRSAFESLKSPSKKMEPEKDSPPPQPKSPSSVSREEETRTRRLAWMRSAKEIMSQNLSPSVLRKDIKSNPNVSTTHLLRRIGNPRRRVIHQMLRDQNKRILEEMKQQVATKAAFSPNASPPTVPPSPVAVAISK